MEYLKKEEVIKIIKRRFENRYYIRKPTAWCCMLTGGTNEHRQYLDLYPINTTPKNGHLIIEFKAENPNVQPHLDWIRCAVENSWNDFCGLSRLQRADFEIDLLKENTD